jgi:geranylgeranyl pyrophosphate synthase/predicted secreted hydrolase
MPGFPADWPGPGDIDLAVHDLPHASSTTEWWYVNAHVDTASGRQLSVFASFFRIAVSQDEVTKEVQYAHSITWALSDANGKRYHQECRVDPNTPRLAMEKLARGEGPRDERLRRAVIEVLARDRVPYPDRKLDAPAFVGPARLHLEFAANTLTRRDDGSYALHLENDVPQVSVDLVLRPTTRPVRHGEDGVVRGTGGEDMFYYFMPLCDASGIVVLPGGDVHAATGKGWYDHEFGRHRAMERGSAREEIGWNWCGLQLTDGRALSAWHMVAEKTGETRGKGCIVVDADGTRHAWSDVELTGLAPWTSTRTFHDYPTTYRLHVPGGAIDLHVDAAFADQEFVTIISKPAFWEGRCTVRGSIGGKAVAGLGYVERSGQGTLDDLDGFFAAVGREVRKSVAAIIPFEPTFEQARDMVASAERTHVMEGVDIPRLVATMVKPVREITDRGGKSWRSYASLVCCDAVGGDSRKYVRWLALPELMHVGSLIIDDIEDGSSWRRGGPAAHVMYGVPLCINAGTACFFQGQKTLVGPQMSAADKLRLYDLYFEALRAGHAGQALDLDGFGHVLDALVEAGDGAEIERRVLALHRLKTAAPAAALARMGAVAGGGTEAQIERLGRFFEAVGLAFQIVDDVLNLRGFERGLKSTGEDVAHGKVTLPVAKAMGRLGLDERRDLATRLALKSSDPQHVAATIGVLEQCGAVSDCAAEARELVEHAWQQLDPLIEDSLPKIMLRAFGWYVLERHY